MPTKTDRILSYLPGTFRALPRPTALYSVVDAFGNELLNAENSLSAVMQAHWVDHADRGAEVIDDLACIAALYGLAPRCDESVEEFREHLKRYVRTFLEGTVTVQGILRVTAEALGLRIADAYEDMDTWWNRAGDELVTVERRGDDAAQLLLGAEKISAAGSSAKAAQVTGDVDLSVGADLRQAATLRLKLDDADSIEINLRAGAAVPAMVTLEEMATAINSGLGSEVAGHDNRYLTLASPTLGPISRLEVQDVPDDAAELVLGLASRVYHGSPAQAAQVTGTADLSGDVDLSQDRYLRLAVDGTQVAEIDCAGSDPAQTTLDQVRDAINDALALPNLASHDGQFLTLVSQSEGFSSSIAFQSPAAQDATARLFGPVDSFHIGTDAQPARFTGRRDLSGGVDLSQGANLQLGVNGGASVTVDCAGEDPADTRPAEIAAAINEALGDRVASHNGRTITLAAEPTVGPDSQIVIETPAENDATQAILGIGPRDFQGAAATEARLIGQSDLSGDVDLTAFDSLQLAVDGAGLVEIDLLSAAINPRAVTLDEIVGAINTELGANIASHDGLHLTLASNTAGGASRLAVVPLETTRRRRFVTRAVITDEASQAVFGFTEAEAQGTPATNARVVGQPDLSRGVELRQARFLRLQIDNQPAVDIDCAGARPRATLLHEVVDTINDAMNMTVAADDGRHLVLFSPSTGAGSRIAFEASRATDALDSLLGVEPGIFRGQSATGINFVGTVDLSEGVELDPDAAIKLGVDGDPPIEIVVGDPETGQRTLNQVVVKINEILEKSVASHDGAHLILTSDPAASPSQISFHVPDGSDATATLFGIIPPRTYQGAEATPAQVKGTKDLAQDPNLVVARFLSLAVDGGEAQVVDCAAQAADPAQVSLGEIVDAINDAMGGDIATQEGSFLVLTSTTTGSSSRITLAAHTEADALPVLLGQVEDEVTGDGPAPAVITGQADLLTPVDLSQRRLIRLAVDDGRPVDIDVAGAAPGTTFLDEVVAAINAVYTGLAAATEDNRLQLTSPGADAGSHLAVLPLRYLELIEYPPPDENETRAWAVKHGDGWSVTNDGAGDVFLDATIKAPQGVVGPTLVNMTLGWRIRLLTIVGVGEAAHLWRDPERGLQVEIIAPDDQRRSVPRSEILVGPLGSQAWVPFAGPWALTGDDDEPATLQLHNPSAPSLIRLHARWVGARGHAISVSVTETDLSAAGPQPDPADGDLARLVGRVQVDETGYRLVDVKENVIAQLWPGPEVNLEAHQDRSVAVIGPWHTGEPPVLVAQHMANLFDVTLDYQPEEGDPVEESYPGVTIGHGAAGPDSLVWQVNAGPHFSHLVKAEELDRAVVLSLPRGRSDWRYMDCFDCRFNQCTFNHGHFAGGLCYDRAVFNVSRFANALPEPVAAVFASPGPLPDPAAEVVFEWAAHQPGAFVVNLPADLPARFGGRFNDTRFGLVGQAPELYEKAVTEPPEDEDFLVDRINAGSKLVQASIEPIVPLGYEAVPMPFRKPRYLTLGDEGQPARLYLVEDDGLSGFIKLEAREAGAWGNEIAVSARRSGPAMYDVSVAFEGARFENARQVAMGQGPATPALRCQKGKNGAGSQAAATGGDLPALIQELLQPGPIGVLHAKAAGVRAAVTRDRT